jgi:hypothetical protein
MQRALMGLPPNQREVLLLVVWEQLRARASRRPHSVVFCQRSAHFTSFTVMTSVMARAN